MDGQFKELRELIVQRDVSFRAYLDERFVQMEERDRLLRAYVEERFNQIHEYIDERTHDNETRLLKGFQRWSVSMELAVKPMPIRMASIEERVSLMEERLKDYGNQSL